MATRTKDGLMTTIYDINTFSLRDGFGQRVARVRKAIIDQIEQELAALDISGAQWLVLLLMADEGIACPADLCKRMSYDTGAMTRLLDRLEGKNLIERQRADGDRRSLRLELTDQGRALYPRIRTALVDVYNRLLVGFTVDDVDTLNALLDRILANAHA